MDKLNKTLNSALEPLKKEPVKSALFVFFILYGSLAGPQLPSLVKGLFDNFVFRLLFLSLMLWSGNSNPSLSILMAVVFTLSANWLSDQKEEFTVLHPRHRVLNGCEKVKLSDLVDSFDGDQEKLEKTAKNAGLPHNIEFNDFNAPEIATYLINYGHFLSSKHEECNIAPGKGLF